MSEKSKDLMESKGSIREEVFPIFESGDYRKLSTLLEDGLDPNIKIEENDCCLLHLAVGIDYPNQCSIIKLLLAKGADPNARGMDGLTPVHISAMWGNTDVLDLLLCMGGNMWLCDDFGKSTLDMAVESCEYECLTILQNHQRKIIFSTVCRETVLPTSSCERYNSRKEDIISSNTGRISRAKTIPNMDTRTLTLQPDVICKNQLKTISNCEILVEETLPECSSDTYADTQSCLNKGFFGSPQSEASIDGQFCIVSPQKTEYSEKDSSSTIVYTHNSISHFHNIEEVLYSDEENGVLLLEQRHPSSLRSPSGSCQGSEDDSYHTPPEKLLDERVEVSSDGQLEMMSNSKLRGELLRVGDSPGPVTDSTRCVYLQRFKQVKNGNFVALNANSSPFAGYSTELVQILQNNFDLKVMLQLEEELCSEFDIPNERKNWREGIQKTSFNYLLLNPAITQKLPIRCTNLTFPEQFIAFVKAIFYVGKGKRSRPYSHLYDAVHLFKKGNKEKVDSKIKTILEIWGTGEGVISLHCFQNTIACDAYTREACMIETLGLENLTNAKRGDYYGPAVKWTSKKRRIFGAFLLYRALHVFLYEGERQLRPADVIK